MPLPRRIAHAAGIDSRSAVVLHSLVRDGPGEKAGLLEGDVLVCIDGRPVAGAGALLRMLHADAVGRQAVARVLRQGRFVEVTVTPGQRPASAPGN